MADPLLRLLEVEKLGLQENAADTEGWARGACRRGCAPACARRTWGATSPRRCRRRARLAVAARRWCCPPTPRGTKAAASPCRCRISRPPRRMPSRTDLAGGRQAAGELLRLSGQALDPVRTRRAVARAVKPGAGHVGGAERTGRCARCPARGHPRPGTATGGRHRRAHSREAGADRRRIDARACTRHPRTTGCTWPAAPSARACRWRPAPPSARAGGGAGMRAARGAQLPAGRTVPDRPGGLMSVQGMRSSPSSDHLPPPRPTRYSSSPAHDRWVGQASG